MLSARIEAIRKTPLFGTLEPEELTAIARRSNDVKLGRGEILFLAGDTPHGLWVIVSGAVRAYRVGPDGREQIIHVERAGTTVGEVPLFDEGVYPSTVAGEEPSTLLFVSRTDFQRLLVEHPKIAMAAVKVLARRLRNLAGLVETLSLHDVDRRLARLLLAETQGRATGENDAVELDFALTHQQIASRIGSVREVVSRAFGRLSQAGLVRMEGKHILIPSRRSLAQFAETG